MKRRLVLVAGVAVVAALAVVATVLAQSDASDIETAPAFSIDDARAHGGDDWISTTGGITANRYSTLDDIDTSNVATLKQAWHAKLGIPAKELAAESQEATPVAYKGTLYLPDGVSRVYALDGKTGKQLWKYDPHIKQPGLAANRGVAIGDGRVYIGRGDAHVVAIDQKTGKEIWDTALGVASAGYSFTSAPVYYNGMVIEGMSGGDSGARSFAVALNPKTGKEKWRWYVAAGPGEVGSGTWTGEEWQHGGGIWIYPSIAPSLGLLYIVTGNPVPWNGRGPGDNLWTDSIVALHASNGQFAWGFQTVHHDIWDYDVTQAPLLFDTNVKGVYKHGVAIPSKTGWVYILDRATGKPLLGIPEKAVPQYPKGSPEAAYANLSPTQPYPVGDTFANQCATRKEFPNPAPDGKPFRIGCIFTPYSMSKKGTFVAWKPAAAVDWPPSSYDPQTHLIYLCTTQGPGASIGAIPKSQQLLFPGGNWIGANFGGGAVTAATGRVVAMDVSTNKIAWKGPDWPAPCYSGLLTTAGGLVFGGQSETKKGKTIIGSTNASSAKLTALDAQTGKALWNSEHLDAGANAPPMTYKVDGKQYVAIIAGGNSLFGSKTGDNVYAFTLP